MILNQAENIMLGSREVQKVYLGSELIWERKKQEIPLAELKLTGYTPGQTMIENLGNGGELFVASSKGGSLENDISQAENGIHLKGKGQLGIYCNWNLPQFTVIITLHINDLATGNMYTRIMANSSSQFEVFIPRNSSGSPYPEQLTFTLAGAGGSPGTPVSSQVHTVSGFGAWLTADNLPSSALIGKDVTFRIVNDGTNVTFCVDNTALAQMNTAFFRQYNTNPFIGIGTADDWSEAASADVTVRKFEIYGKAL